MGRRKKQRGSAIVEFTLTGVPVIFVWISIVQMAIGMWHYQVLQSAVKVAAAYGSVHGATYKNAGASVVHISDVAQVLANYMIGMPPSSINVTFTAWKNSSDATSDTNATTYTCELDNCISQSTYQTAAWPPGSGYDAPNGSEFSIKAVYVFHSGICMVAPGPGTSPIHANSYTLPGYTHQMVLF
jgi:Flp pilus assembly protein TadG